MSESSTPLQLPTWVLPGSGGSVSPIGVEHRLISASLIWTWMWDKSDPVEPAIPRAGFWGNGPGSDGTHEWRGIPVPGTCLGGIGLLSTWDGGV